MNRTHIQHFASLLALSLLIVFFVSCDGIGDFGDMNEDPTAAEEIDPGLEFTALQLGVAGSRYETWRTNLIYAETIVQHMARELGYWVGNFNGYIGSFSGSYWNSKYAGGVNNSNFLATVKNVENLLGRLEGDEQANRIAAARIMRVLIYHRLTDTYGDIPYFEAGTAETLKPHFNRQDSIYVDLHTELQEAIDQFDSSQPTYGDADLIYGGDIDQWRKFANSLQLRLALRQVKVNPNRAQQWAQEAINGGVMESPADDAFIPHQDGPSGGPAGFNTNANSEVMTGFGDLAKLSDTFVSWMKNRNDPRLSTFGAIIRGDQVVTHPDSQRGMPNGFTANELENSANFSGNPDDYSKVNPVVRDLNDPIFLQTYAEVEFMLAEAEERWGIAPRSAESHYEAGVEAAMRSLSKYGGDAEISQSAIDQYLNNNPYNPSNQEEALELINNQYWAATFLNGLEAWANWRRSGYPDLQPADEQGITGGQIIRRLAYPQNEQDVNTDNYDEARQRQSIPEGNPLSTRVWWDCGTYADQCVN